MKASNAIAGAFQQSLSKHAFASVETEDTAGVFGDATGAGSGFITESRHESVESPILGLGFKAGPYSFESADVQGLSDGGRNHDPEELKLMIHR